MIVSTTLIICSLVLTYIQLRCMALCIIFFGLWVAYCFLIDSVKNLTESNRSLLKLLDKVQSSQKDFRDITEKTLELNKELNSDMFNLKSLLRKKGLLNGLHEVEREATS